jgi:hypothetical protein
MQQKLRGRLSVNGAGFITDLYGMPTALVLLGASFALVVINTLQILMRGT